MTWSEYLASIDWVGAVVVAWILVTVGMVALRFLVAATDEVGAMLPGVADAAADAVLDARGALAIDHWVCATCRSVNTPQATRCYRRCGPREALATSLPVDRQLVAQGHNGRRNPGRRA